MLHPTCIVRTRGRPSHCCAAAFLGRGRSRIATCAMRLYNISSVPHCTQAEAGSVLTRIPSLDRAAAARAAAGRPQGDARAAGPRRAKRLVVLCALLLALLWQSVLTQAHQHRPVGLDTSQSERSLANKTGRDDPAPDSPKTCPICLEVASAGPALLPTPVTLAAPAAPTFFTAAFRPLQFQRASRSHLWQSRAPPHQLQARGTP